MRTDLAFSSAGTPCAAWWYPPPGPTPAPVVVLGIGLGSTREMGLDSYARAFQAEGYAALAFDYRSFGASGGEPRQVLDVAAQLDDWRAAVAAARAQPGVDADRVVLWGTSFGGGHIVRLASERPDGVVAALAQCPFTDGLRSALALDPVSSLRVGVRAVRDLVAQRRGRSPVYVATAGEPRSAAMMTAPDALDGFLGLVPDEARPAFRNEVAARIGLRILGYRPGRRAARIEVPLWVGVCEDDTVAPPRTAARQLARAPRAEIAAYATGHFAVYHDAARDRALADQVAFLRRHVPVAAG